MPRVPRIAVVGSANVDLTTFTDRFPRPGETIFGREFHLGFGGKGANQAVAARLCGAEVSMIARLGDDLFGPATVQNFRSFGIDATHVHITPSVSSGVAPIFVDTAGQNRILVIKGANDRLLPADIDAASDVLASADFIVLQLEIPLDTVYYTLRFARERNVRTILNPAPGQPLDAREIANADYLIPNETEAEAITGIALEGLEGARACAAHLIGRGQPRVIVTLGANGALLATADGMRHIPAFPVDAFDSTGAGDAFIGSLACFLASGFDESEAISRANLYAALSTLSAGTQKSFVTLEKFEAEWEGKRRGRSVAVVRD
ncbi:MAG: ribokinase [Acidobacteriaceae bacterium]|nr:ribokinase [Acidobacteriaceae bacterium]